MLLGVNRIAMSYYDPIDAGIQAQFNKENCFPRRNPPITEFPNPYDSDDSEDEAQNRLRRGAWEFHGRQMRERNQEYIIRKKAEDAQKSRKEAIKKAEEAIKKAEEAIKKIDKAEDTANAVLLGRNPQKKRLVFHAHVSASNIYIIVQFVFLLNFIFNDIAITHKHYIDIHIRRLHHNKWILTQNYRGKLFNVYLRMIHK